MAVVDDVKKFMDECGYYFLATVEGDQPRVRPFGAHAIIDGKLYLQSGKVKAVAHQLAANPKVELCASKPDSWIRITGRLVEDPRIEVQEAFLDANPGLKSMYAAGDGNTVVYYFDDAEVGFYSFVSEPRVEKF